MDISRLLYFNFYSIGAFIPVVFHFMIVLLLLSVRHKSSATRHFMASYIYFTVMNCGYFICASLYHPAAAYHRWITVACTFMVIGHCSMVFFYFPDTKAPRFARAFLIAQYAISIAVTLIFCAGTWNGAKQFHFAGHYWDFDTPLLNRFVSIVIEFYVLALLIITIWRTVITKEKIRWVVLGIGVALLSASVPSSLANTLSREGALDRGTYQIIWDLCVVFGMFIVVVLYANNAKDRISFVGKFMGISLMTFLTVLQFLGYFSLTDREDAYDDIRRESFARALEGPYRSADLQYLTAFEVGSGTLRPLTESMPAVDLSALRLEQTNTFILESIRSLPAARFAGEMETTLSLGHPYFEGYRRFIRNVMHASSPKATTGARVAGEILGIERVVLYRYNKIRQFPDNGFRGSLAAFLKKDQGLFAPFQSAINDYLKTSSLEGGELKAAVLKFMTPMIPQDRRCYRQQNDRLNHHVAFMHADVKNKIVYEAGFSYIAYRHYLHPPALKIFIILFALIFVVRFGFQFLFGNMLIAPVRALIQGVKEVNDGNLDVFVPVRIEDELGYITHSFNTMVGSIRQAKHDLQDYAENLEQKVLSRTQELQAANEEMAAINDNLTATRDALWGEMQLAKKIQTVLLPEDPSIPNFEIAAHMIPSHDVGGDYYDIIEAGGYFWIVIGDVSGHGVPAGLIMMMVQTAIHTVLEQDPLLSPASMLALINRTIHKNVMRLEEDKYMTITVLAAFKEGKFIFSGLHQDILIYRASVGKVQVVETEGMWIGVFDDISSMVNNKNLVLHQGDVMLLFTDGITEAMEKGSVKDHRDPDAVMFGEKKLIRVLYDHGRKSCKEIHDAIIESMRDYEQNDDVTFIVMKRLA